MKKIIISIIVFLIIILLIVFIALKVLSSNQATKYEELKSTILSNSKWVDLSTEDFNGLLRKSYSNNILEIINSLEDSVPVILKISDNKFSDDPNNNFIVASSFDENNNIHIYVYNFKTEKYTKHISSLTNLLENATSAFIPNKVEVLR